MEKLSDAEFAGRALRHLPRHTTSAGFEAALLAGYDGWRTNRPKGRLAALTGAVHGFADFVWPGAPTWAMAGALATSLVLGIVAGAFLPAMRERGMNFSLDSTPGFTLLADQDESL
jgi:hypothetical protein